MTSSYVIYLHNSLGNIRMGINSSTIFIQQIIFFVVPINLLFTVYTIAIASDIHYYYMSINSSTMFTQQITSIHNTYKLTTTFIIYCLYYYHRIRHLLLLQLCRPTLAFQMIFMHTLNIIDCTTIQYSLMHIPH